LFERATEASDAQKKAELIDRLEVIKAGWIVDKALDKKVTEEKYFEELIDEKIISDRSDVTGPTQDGENKIYEVTTNDGFIVEIIVDEKGNIIIGEITKGDSLLPKITGIETSTTKISFTAKANVVRINGGTIKYYYKLSTDSNYTEITEVTENGVTVEGLTEGAVYDIKVEVSNANTEEPITKETQVKAQDIVLITGITLNKTEGTIAQGKILTLTSTIEPSNATNQKLIWTSSNESIATVNENGVVTAISIGSVVITAKTIDGSDIEAICTVNVTEVTYLFNKGDQCEDITGGWRGGTQSSNTNVNIGDKLQLSAGTNVGINIYTNNMISLEGYSEIVVVYDAINKNSGGGPDISFDLDPFNDYPADRWMSNTWTSSESPIVLNCSEINDTRYLSINAWSGSSWSIEQIYLRK